VRIGRVVRGLISAKGFKVVCQTLNVFGQLLGFSKMVKAAVIKFASFQ